MKLLITGASGFLGKHVLNAFKTYNDIEITYYSSKDFDLTNYNDAIKCIEFVNPDTILHMAALCGGILANKQRPATFINANTRMALNIYDAALYCKVSSIISLGSVCSYGLHCPVPFKEENLFSEEPEPTNKFYGQAKRTLFYLSQAYRQEHGIKGAHLIPVNLYGEYDNFDLQSSHVIPALIRKFTEAVKYGNDTVECWGSGNATREFLYAGDAALAISKAVATNFDYTEPVNLGTGKEISITDLAVLIAKLTGFEGKIVFNGTVSDGQPKRMLDVSRAKELLDFTANTTLEEGLIKTINWYKSTLL